MSAKRYFTLVLFAAAALLAACGMIQQPASTGTPAPVPTDAAPTAIPPTEAPPPTGTPAPAPSPTAQPLSFAAATYRDEAAGFELDYPAAWTLPSYEEQGDRGAIVQAAENGEPRLDIVVLRWDPVGDLPAFIETRKVAWEASGMTLLSEEDRLLGEGVPAAAFVLQTVEGEQAYFFFTEIGDRYLQLSGSGDLDVLKEIGGTVRLFGPEGEAGALDCAAPQEGTAEWVACNVADGLRSRNLSALHGYMGDPFTIGYWGSEGRAASPGEITDELAQSRLPADPATPLTFITDPAMFPSLQGQPPGAMFGPDVQATLIVYSKGWGEDSQGAALLYFAQNAAGEHYWHGMIYANEGFDN